jgi:polygalacturonase
MKLTFTNSLMDGITIKNTPTHAVSIDGVTGSTFQNLVVDNSAGDVPNSLSGTLAAAHNTDGFDVANVENILMQNVKVYGQDDCVALSVSSNTVFKNFYCSGTHGLSIAGGGGGQNNITNVL